MKTVHIVYRGEMLVDGEPSGIAVPSFSSCIALLDQTTIPRERAIDAELAGMVMDLSRMVRGKMDGSHPGEHADSFHAELVVAIHTAFGL